MTAKVSDRLVEIVAATTMVMVGIIGYLNDARQQSIIDAQKATNSTLQEVVRTLGTYNVRFENHEGRIKGNTEDTSENRRAIKDVNVIVNSINQEIDKLKGTNNGR